MSYVIVTLLSFVIGFIFGGRRSTNDSVVDVGMKKAKAFFEMKNGKEADDDGCVLDVYHVSKSLFLWHCGGRMDKFMCRLVPKDDRVCVRKSGYEFFVCSTCNKWREDYATSCW